MKKEDIKKADDKMYWKNWSYWLKGGLIGAGISIVFIIIYIVILFQRVGARNVPYLLIFSGMPTIMLTFFVDGWSPVDSISILVSVLINHFLIGAIIGYIYGKFKSKK